MWTRLRRTLDGVLYRCGYTPTWRYLAEVASCTTLRRTFLHVLKEDQEQVNRLEDENARLLEELEELQLAVQPDPHLKVPPE